MEERILDEEEGRSIKVKRTKEGAIDDVVDALTAAAEEETVEEEIILDFPEEGEEYDEDLVGLTPEQLKKERERREKIAREAREKCAELAAEGEERLAEEKFDEAAAFFTQALLYESEDGRALRGYWSARTENFANAEVFYEEEAALKVSQSSAEIKEFIRSHVRERLESERTALRAEEQPLERTVEEGKQKRRGAFAANRNYYRVRTYTLLALAVLFVIGCAVSATFIVRTTELTPVVLTGVFGGVAFLLFAICVGYCRKLTVAARLVRDNERMTSTDDGRRLYEIKQKLARISEVLDDADEPADEAQSE